MAERCAQIGWRLKDGKIVEHQALFDTAHLLTRHASLKEMVGAARIELATPTMST
jgi:hypothetical protein